VLRRIELDQGRRKLVEILFGFVADRQTRAADERLGLLRNFGDVLVLRDRPERNPFGLLVPVNRILGTQTGPDIVGIPECSVVFGVHEVEVRNVSHSGRHRQLSFNEFVAILGPPTDVNLSGAAGEDPPPAPAEAAGITRSRGISA
jgi:hypothetical protein